LAEFLVIIELKGNNTETLKGHIISKRITADTAEEAVGKATQGKIFEEEGFEIITVQPLTGVAG
jgi:hypothetical protein